MSSAAINAGAQTLDAKFEKMPAWSVVKREFPDWYGEQLRQAAQLSAQNQPEHEVNKHLAEALVALRRQHANEALAASTERLKAVATSFLDNLKSLANQSVGACYGFISQGETAPAVLEVLQSPEQGAAVQAQVAAIFEAIADGRKSPTTHDKAAKTDYDVLVQELTKLGWKENDLQRVLQPDDAVARAARARLQDGAGLVLGASGRGRPGHAGAAAGRDPKARRLRLIPTKCHPRACPKDPIIGLLCGLPTLLVACHNVHS